MYWDMCSYFRHFEVSFQKFQNHVLFFQEPELAPDKKFPEPSQNRLESETQLLHYKYPYYTINSPITL